MELDDAGGLEQFVQHRCRGFRLFNGIQLNVQKLDHFIPVPIVQKRRDGFSLDLVGQANAFQTGFQLFFVRRFFYPGQDGFQGDCPISPVLFRNVDH